MRFIVSVLGLLFLFSCAEAEVIFDRPPLPDGYETWPHHSEIACVLSIRDAIIVQSWAKVELRGIQRGVEVVTVTSVGKIVLYRAYTRVGISPQFAYLYFPEKGKWLKLEIVDENSYARSHAFFEGMLRQVMGISYEDYRANCADAIAEEHNFRSNLWEIK